MISIILLIALLVGSFLYWSELTGKVVRTYWSVFLGFFVLAIWIPGTIVMFVHIVTVGCFYAHAKMKASGNF